MGKTVQEVDKDFNGRIDIQEYTQLLRKIFLRREAETRARENRLINQSQIPVKEVEEWVSIYRNHDTNHCNGLSLSQLCNLFKSIGIKWNHSGNDTLAAWMKETDEDSNNILDFGEFCCLIKKMVAEDFCGIGALSAGKHVGISADATVDKIRWSSARCISLAGSTDSVEPLSPTLAPRASDEFDDNGSQEEARTMSHTSAPPLLEEVEETINVLEEKLAARAASKAAGLVP